MKFIKTNFDKAHKDVSKLANTFKAGEAHFLRPEYSETDVRNEFINKFFIAIGWDVTWDVQRNPYQREVEVEKTVEDNERRKKKADYSFSLAPNYGVPVFFVEAKKPARDLLNADDYLQAINYGYHKGVPIVVLTDFEEFHIIDSRYKTTVDTALNRKLKQYNYLDYQDKEKFAEIYYLFSREAVAENSIALYGEKLPTPKKKGGKSYTPKGTKSIDEALLDELEIVRENLAKAFKKTNPSLNSEQLTEATQRAVDRLVFFRFIEDKMFEPDSFIKSYIESKTPWKYFVSDCTRLDAKYNGVVFKKHFIDKPSFNPPNHKDFIAICKRMANPEYYYDVIPIHMLGSIYERFLGKVIFATAKQVTLKQKPDVLKAGGVFYTPEYIVRYIVENTIGKLIDGKSPLQISRMRFADIACGSGSFLISVFDYLLTYHNNWYNENPAKAKVDGCIYIKEDDKWVISLKQKREILVNNIYGVDIDQQAVEVTELSLYLKLLEDETTATAHEMSGFFTLLPDLSRNIICGNSLIEPDILYSDLFSLTEEEERKINPLAFDNAFPNIMRKGGFDAIVGNPPWGAELSPIQLEYLRSKHHKIIVRMIDTFMYFIHKGSKLLKSGGTFGYIIPDVILYQEDNRKLREYLLSEYKLNIIINSGDVFKGVRRPTAIVSFDHAKPTRNIVSIADITKFKGAEKQIAINTKSNFGTVSQKQLSEISNSLFVTSNPEHYVILRTMEKTKHSKLVDLVDDDGIQRGVSPDLKEAFIVSETDVRMYDLEREKVKPVLTGGREVKRFQIIANADKFLIYTSRQDDFSKLPNICKFIEQFKDSITCKEVKQKKHPLYALHRPRKEHIFLKSPKIIGVITEDEIIVSLDENQFYTTDGLYLFGLKEGIHHNFILGVLNSTLFIFVYRLLAMEKGRMLAQVKPTLLNRLPIRLIENDDPSEKMAHDKIVLMVREIMEAKKKAALAKTDKDINYYERKTSNLTREIDKQVYALYNISEKEQEIIESEK